MMQLKGRESFVETRFRLIRFLLNRIDQRYDGSLTVFSLDVVNLSRKIDQLKIESWVK
jgi:hypothetical protein